MVIPNLKKYVRTPNILALVFAVISAVSAFKSAVDQDDAQKQNEKNQKVISDQASKIEALNEKLVSIISGEKSNAWALFYQSQNGTGYTLDIMNRTDVPVYDLVIVAECLQEVENKPGLFYGGPGVRWVIGNVPPHGFVPKVDNGELQIRDGALNKILLTFMARNGHWEQEIFFIKQGNSHHIASRASKKINGAMEIIKEYSTDNFPTHFTWRD